MAGGLIYTNYKPTLQTVTKIVACMEAQSNGGFMTSSSSYWWQGAMGMMYSLIGQTVPHISFAAQPGYVNSNGAVDENAYGIVGGTGTYRITQFQGAYADLLLNPWDSANGAVTTNVSTWVKGGLWNAYLKGMADIGLNNLPSTALLITDGYRWENDTQLTSSDLGPDGVTYMLNAKSRLVNELYRANQPNLTVGRMPVFLGMSAFGESITAAGLHACRNAILQQVNGNNNVHYFNGGNYDVVCRDTVSSHMDDTGDKIAAFRMGIAKARKLWEMGFATTDLSWLAGLGARISQWQSLGTGTKQVRIIHAHDRGDDLTMPSNFNPKAYSFNETNGTSYSVVSAAYENYRSVILTLSGDPSSTCTLDFCGNNPFLGLNSLVADNFHSKTFPSWATPLLANIFPAYPLAVQKLDQVLVRDAVAPVNADNFQLGTLSSTGGSAGTSGGGISSSSGGSTSVGSSSGSSSASSAGSSSAGSAAGATSVSFVVPNPLVSSTSTVITGTLNATASNVDFAWVTTGVPAATSSDWTRTSMSGLTVSAAMNIDHPGTTSTLWYRINGGAALLGFSAAPVASSSTTVAGLPFFRGNSSSYNTAYDSFVFSNAAAATLFTPLGNAWTYTLVIRQTGVGTSLMRVYSSSGNINIQPVSGTTDGAMHLEQNNGAAEGNEPSSAATALGQLQVMTILCDSNTLSIYRNGVRTYQTPAAPAGKMSGLTGITNFEILNNPQADIYYVEFTNGAPSIAQLDAETKALAARFLIPAANITAVTQGPASQIPPIVVDATQAWMGSPNFPVSDQLPTVANPTLAHGLTLASGATSLACITFTPGGTTDTRAKLDAQVYYNPFTGNQSAVTGSDGIEGVTTCWTRVRRYADGSPYNLHTFGPNGLSINAICYKNNTTPSNGNMYGGMIRLPTPILPGMTIELTWITPLSELAWCPMWLFCGTQKTPGPGGNPYAGYGTTSSLIQAENDSTKYFEYDFNDNYYSQGFPVGSQFNTTFINEKPSTFVKQPYDVYVANGPKFKYSSNPALIALEDGTRTNTGPHVMTFNWRNDGSNLMDSFFDGVLMRTQYWEYTASTYTDAAGATHQVAMHLIFGNQCIPNFLPSSLTAGVVPQDGGAIAGGPWSATVSKIQIIQGNITAASIAAATTDSNYV